VLAAIFSSSRSRTYWNCDFDVVDSSNLHRQVIHGTSWVGKPKIESAKNRVLEINPNCQVDLYETRLTSENALDLILPL